MWWVRQRIVSFVRRVATEAVCRDCAAARMVGRIALLRLSARWSRSFPHVGRYVDPIFERILALTNPRISWSASLG